MLNSFVLIQVYHDVQITVDQGMKQVISLVEIHENVCNLKNQRNFKLNPPQKRMEKISFKIIEINEVGIKLEF